jgi:hypothetical protein
MMLVRGDLPITTLEDRLMIRHMMEALTEPGQRTEVYIGIKADAQ